MIFQTKRVTSSAGGDLVYPSKALILWITFYINIEYHEWIKPLYLQWYENVDLFSSNEIFEQCFVSMASPPPQRQLISPSSQSLEPRRTEAGLEAGGWSLTITRCRCHMKTYLLWQLYLPFQGFTVLYLHGISNSRAYYHRIGLYKTLLGRYCY